MILIVSQKYQISKVQVVVYDMLVGFANLEVVVPAQEVGDLVAEGALAGWEVLWVVF